MIFRESLQKTRNLVQMTLQNLKTFFFGGYQKLPKPPLLNPLSCSCSRSGSARKHQTDQFYADFCNQWDYDLDKARKRMKNASKEEPTTDEEDTSNGSLMKLGEQSPMRKKQEKTINVRIQSSHLGNKGEGKRYQKQKVNNDGGDYFALARKMKELEMMGVSDMEHVLDVEEALHYYSRLKSPVYLDIVDSFFMDMYSEFSVPQATLSISNSKRRLGSIRL